MLRQEGDMPAVCAGSRTVKKDKDTVSGTFALFCYCCSRFKTILGICFACASTASEACVKIRCFV